MNATLNTIANNARNQIAAWTAHIEEVAERSRYATAIVGQPFVVVLDGLTVRVDGGTATPIAIRPGCVGASHFDRKDAETVARLMGDGWTVVAARDVGAIEIARLTNLIALITA